MNQKQQQFEKEITRYVNENQVTIVNANDSGKIPVYLAQAGYKVIVAGSEKTLNPYNRFKDVSKADLNVGYSTGLPYLSSNYQILFTVYGAELIRQILDNQDSNIVLIIEDSHNSMSANLLFTFTRHLINSGSGLRLLIINKIAKYNEAISNFFGNISIIQSPTSRFHVSLIQKAPEDIEEIILSGFLLSSHRYFLVLLPGEDEIKSLRDRLQLLFSQHGIQGSILSISSNSSSETRKKYSSTSSDTRVILTTDLAQNLPSLVDIDIIIDTGLERKVEIVNGFETFTLRHISRADIDERMALAGKRSPGIYYLCSDLGYNDRKEFRTIFEENFNNTLLAIMSSDINVLDLKLISTKMRDYIEKSLDLFKMFGAIDDNQKLTEIGRQMAMLPMEVRFSRIFVEAKKYGIESDVLITYMIFKFGIIANYPMDDMAYTLDSDLFGQLYTFKKLYFGHKPSGTKQIRWNRYKKGEAFLKKMSSLLNVNIIPETNTSDLKKCLACGLPDLLFILKKGIGYFNDISGRPWDTFTDSALAQKKTNYIVGFPLNFVDTFNNKDYTRLLFPTAYTFSEVLECFSGCFTTTYSNCYGDIYENKMYNGITIQAKCIGTLEHLRASDPDAFREEKEVDKCSGETWISLYYHNSKLDSKPWVKLV